MQRILTSLILLAISIVVFHTVLTKRSGQVSLKIKDIREHGLVIVGRSDPDFESLNGTLSKEGVRLDLSIQPYVFIKNLGNKRMIAYSLKWELLKDDGRVVTKTRSYSREDILMGKEAPEDPSDRIVLRPNAARLFSLAGYGDGQEISLTPVSTTGAKSDTEILQKLEQTGLLTGVGKELNHTVGVTVTLDGAFFEDGTFVGPNTSRFFERTSMQIDAKNHMVQEILKRLNQGDTPADVMKYLSAKADTLGEANSPAGHRAKPEEVFKSEEKRFLDDALGIRAFAGDDELAVRRILQYNKPTHHLKLRKVD
jgi:hypothetical protein